MNSQDKIFIGIDPGKTGAIATLVFKSMSLTDKPLISLYNMPETPNDFHRLIASMHGPQTMGVYERVHSSPQQGVSSAFTFGKYVGYVEMVAAITGIPFAEVTPQKWQTAINCLTRGEKKVSKQHAQRLFPEAAEKITLQNADSLLIAYYCVRKYGR